MASFNSVTLLGNLTRDPDLKYAQSGMQICSFGIACNRKYKDVDEVMFIDCTAFGKTAEVVSQYCRKGKQVLLSGRLKLEQWEDKNGGGKRSKHVVIIENFQMLGGKDERPLADTGPNADKWPENPQPTSDDIPF